jgi:hypothetical protein
VKRSSCDSAYLAGSGTPSRVLSITSIMSSPDLGPKNDAFTGQPSKTEQLPQPASHYAAAVITLNCSPAGSDVEAAIRFMENFRLAAGPKNRPSMKFSDWNWARRSPRGPVMVRRLPITAITAKPDRDGAFDCK